MRKQANTFLLTTLILGVISSVSSVHAEGTLQKVEGKVIKAVSQVQAAANQEKNTATQVAGKVAQVKLYLTTNEYANHPAKVDIDYVLKNNLMWKFSDGTFRPEEVITQAQFVASLVAVRGLKDKTLLPTIPAGHWAKDVYEKAAKAGILNGVKIDFNKRLTKEEVAMLAMNAWKVYRGNKPAGVTYSSALTKWGWMPKKGTYLGEVPYTRADTAILLKNLHEDRLGIELAEKYVSDFHNGLKISNGVLSGRLPNNQQNLLFKLILISKDYQRTSITPGSAFSVKISDLAQMYINVTSNIDSSNLSRYSYPKLPDIRVRTEMRQKFDS
ncbi:S-layer homology domain-containing protein [Brevibacillus sp. SYP-B805]|uniref:S-layer homology domain-containing protein n=1 Tax=Brevibacillus sp. SYP-B805 TaxID=1578199 RepID=UPI0013EC93BB|nr:S-layer homology domain-containing protein [Brevibacillus sp. SYP-B805]NGQ94870.1 S-layer homology domain-containing protein [Brevibacillus sp. SYP-B805]